MCKCCCQGCILIYIPIMSINTEQQNSERHARQNRQGNIACHAHAHTLVLCVMCYCVDVPVWVGGLVSASRSCIHSNHPPGAMIDKDYVQLVLLPQLMFLGHQWDLATGLPSVLVWWSIRYLCDDVQVDGRAREARKEGEGGKLVRVLVPSCGCGWRERRVEREGRWSVVVCITVGGGGGWGLRGREAKWCAFASLSVSYMNIVYMYMHVIVKNPIYHAVYWWVCLW